MQINGIVTKSTGSWYWVEANESRWQCRLRGKIRLKGLKSTNPVAVGDFVVIEPQEEEGKAVIVELLPRKNYILRRSVNLSKQVHILAANVDLCLLIATLAYPKTHIRFIDRLAVTAEAYGVPFGIVFNKLDLYDEAQMEELEYLKIVYKNAGYIVMESSVVDNLGVETLQELLKGKTTLLSGHSGVGKSSLINKIQPHLNLKTNRISLAHEQGQHTTTFAEMHSLSFGGSIVDTPGIKGFGLVDMEPSEMGDYFPEIFALKRDCKFHNCLHLYEPGCAVKEALDKAQIAPTRYESYVNFVEGTDDEDTYRKDIYAE